MALVELAEWFQHQPHVTLLCLDLALHRPQSRDETINEETGWNEQIPGEEVFPMIVVSQSASVGMGEQHVVVLGEKADRRGCIAVNERRLRKIEQLSAMLIAEQA